MGTSPNRSDTPPLLLYDGDCGFCAASVQFVLRHERQQTLRFAALEGQMAMRIRARHGELDGVDSLVWVDGAETAWETVEVRSAAVLRAAAYLGWPWRLLGLGTLLPRALRDALYDFIARHRHKLVPRTEACFIPPPDVRSRFLE